MTKSNDDVVLNSYLVQHLQPLTEADPTILAKYVSALLKNNKPKKDLQAFCIEKLVDFLGEDANNFVVNLFQALEDGTISASKDPDDNSVTEEMIRVQAGAAGAKVSLATDNIEPKTSSQLERNSDTSNARFSDYEEEGTEDEDDDRNHKHRRRAQRSRSLDRDSEDGPLRKRNRPAFDTQSYNTNPTHEAHRGSNTLEKDGLPKRRLSRDNVSGAPSRFVGDISQRVASRGGALLRIDGIRSRFEHQNGLFRGAMGRGRGASTSSWGAREPRAAVIDGLDFNLSMLPSGPLKNIYPARSSSSLGNAASSWAGYNRFTGLTNGTLDQGLPLNTGMQGSRGGPISAALGININIGMGLGRPRCPDFEERGYCLRGDLCPMEHGANRIVVEDVQSLQKFNLPVALPSGRGMALGSVSNFGSSIVPGETNKANLIDSGITKAALVINTNTEPELYDPDQPLWNKEQSAALADGLRRLPSFHSGPENNVLHSEGLDGGKRESPDREEYGKSSATSVRSQGLTAGQSVWNRIVGVDQVDFREGNGSSFNDLTIGNLQQTKAFKKEAASPNARIDTASKGEVGLNHGGQNYLTARSFRLPKERAFKTLFVGCIPINPNTHELLLAHFRKFGDVVDIRLLLNGEKAFVQFSRHEDAEAALASPEAVMGNRFIRLSWAKRDSVQVSFPEGNTTQGPGGELGGFERCGSDTSRTTGKKQVSTSASEGIALQSAPRSNLNVESSLPAASQKKREELEHMKEELRKKQEELAQKRDEFRRKLEQISQQSKRKSSEGAPGKGSGPTEMASKADMKEDQMEERVMAERQEADGNKQPAVGIEKGSSSIDQAPSTHVKGTSKQPLVVVQGPSANTFQPSPRSLRGHALWPSTGFSGPTPWTPTRYKIDNRTTVFRVLPPFPDTVLDVPMLKEHFSFFGDVTHVEIDTSDAGKDAMKVTFVTRTAAERAFLQGRWYQGTCLNFSWVNLSPSANTSAALLSSDSTEGEDIDKTLSHSSVSMEKGPEDMEHCQGQMPGIISGVHKDDGLLSGNGAITALDTGLADASGMDDTRTTSNAGNRAIVDS